MQTIWLKHPKLVDRFFGRVGRERFILPANNSPIILWTWMIWCQKANYEQRLSVRVPSRGWIHIPPWGKGKSSTQNAIFGGYVSFLEGIFCMFIFELSDLTPKFELSWKQVINQTMSKPFYNQLASGFNCSIRTWIVSKLLCNNTPETLYDWN